MSALLALCSDAALLAGISICPAVKPQQVKSPMLLLAVAWLLFWPHHGKGLVKKIFHNKPINHGFCIRVVSPPDQEQHQEFK